MTKKGKILVVDDERRNVKLLTAYLKSDGFESLSAYNGEEAIKLAIAENPDVILLDIMMPDMNGFEVTEHLKNDTSTQQIPVVLVTSLDGSQNRVKGLNVGADEFLTKPVNRAELLARVRALRRMKHLNEELNNRHHIVASISENEKQNYNPKRTILVVEDDPQLRKKISKVIELSNLSCLTAENTRQATALLEVERPDLILLDRILPDGDGIEFLGRLKKNPDLVDTPIIIITALADLEPKIAGIDSGADDYLVKPIEHSELIARINASLRRYSATKELRIALSQAQASTVTDQLTKVRNRYYLDADLNYRVAQANRIQSRGFSILMIDIDNFKHVNDVYGHLVGDNVLCEVANCLVQCARAADVVTRFGGEEFCIILPDTGLAEAKHIADRMRSEIAKISLAEVNNQSITVSIGVAEFLTNQENSTTLLSRADDALYQAKKLGRNRVCASTAAATNSDSAKNT